MGCSKFNSMTASCISCVTGFYSSTRFAGLKQVSRSKKRKMLADSQSNHTKYLHHVGNGENKIEFDCRGLRKPLKNVRFFSLACSVFRTGVFIIAFYVLCDPDMTMPSIQCIDILHATASVWMLRRRRFRIQPKIHQSHVDGPRTRRTRSPWRC